MIKGIRKDAKKKKDPITRKKIVCDLVILGGFRFGDV